MKAIELEDLIKETKFHMTDEQLMICVLILHSGFMVTGVFASYEVDDNEKMRQAHKKAWEKLVTLEGYHRAQLRYEDEIK